MCTKIIRECKKWVFHASAMHVRYWIMPVSVRRAHPEYSDKCSLRSGTQCHHERCKSVFSQTRLAYNEYLARILRGTALAGPYTLLAAILLTTRRGPGVTRTGLQW
jgi:hypothetical protein